jgi:hypothetical protein
MTDKQAIKNHPAFLAYSAANPKSVDVADTQLNDSVKDNMGATSVAGEKYEAKTNNGGERGKA